MTEKAPTSARRVSSRSRVRAAFALVLAALLGLAAALPAAAAPIGTVVPTSGPTAGGTSVSATVSAPIEFAQVEAGDSHSLAIATDGTAWAWGWNGSGQLGDGTTTDRSVPVAVTGLAGKTITQVSGGAAHSIALASDGTVWTWGHNGNGQLGDGTTTGSSTALQVAGLAGKTIVAIAAGMYHSVAVASDGTVWAWGSNDDGQLGDGTTTDRSVPVQVTGLTGKTITHVGAGVHHTVALASDGTVWAWGRNADSQLGDGTTTPSPLPVQVTGLTGKTITQISVAGRSHTLALASDGTVWAWGWNGYGQLGDGTVTDRSSAVEVTALVGTTVTRVAAGGAHSLVLAANGAVWSWGWNAYGQSGTGTVGTRTSPAPVTALAGKTITGIAAGGAHSLVSTANGLAWAWGYNNYGGLGDGSTADSSVPVQTVQPGVITGVTIGGTAVTPYSYAGAQAGAGTVTFTTPAHAAGVVDIVFSRSAMSDLTLAQSYTYGNAPVFTSGAAGAGAVGQAYSFPVTTVGTGAPSYQVSAGTLPTGTTIDPVTGVISGTPSAAGTWVFTVTASNAFGSATQTNSITVAAPAASGGGSTAGAASAAGSGHAGTGPGGLAVTGLDGALVSGAGSVAGVLLLAGAVLFIVSRRRAARN